MSHLHPWWKRIFIAIAYVFGYDNSFNHYHETVVRQEDIPKMIELLQKAQEK